MDSGGGQNQGVIVRTIKSRSGGDYTTYDDSVVVIDCGPFWRRLGISWPECQTLWFVKDICGVICVLFTWGLVFYADFVVTFVMLIPAPNQIHSIINGVIFHFFACLALVAHTKCMLTDPVSQYPCAVIITTSYYVV